MADAYIYDAVRTPRGRGKPDGSLHELPPIRLASAVLQALRDRNHLDTALVEDVILGVVSPVGEQGSNIARIAALHAGYDERVAGVQVNRFCASGLEAVNMAAAQIMSGQVDAIIAGGVESMSRVPMSAGGGAWYADPAVAYPTHYVPQGVSADLIATLYGFSREDVDGFALESQRRAAAAWDGGHFARAVIPVHAADGTVALTHDEYRRPETTLETLGKLKPSFDQMGREMGFDTVALHRYPQLERIEHVHTPGNSSGIVDGASGVLIGSREAGERAGLKPRARIRNFASIGSEPTIMLTGPAPATQKVLKRAGMTAADIDLYEVNEAFAAVVLRFASVMDVPMDRINVNGGSIALGHPLGATGGILIATLLDEMERRGVGTGLATLCIGAGMGTATIIERI